jgi:hypothetical protein
MKTKILTTVAALCCAIVLHAQEDRPYQSFFGKEYTQWNGYTGNQDWAVELNHKLQSVYDTMVDGKTYKKFEHFRAHIRRMERTPDNDLLLREDTLTGKLWCRYLDGDEEFLIVDMSLKPGDTIYLREYGQCYYNDTNHYFITTCTVRDTMTRDGRRVIRLSEYVYQPLYFIEGIGCTNLFGYMRCEGVYGPKHSVLVCCQKDDELIRLREDLNPNEDCIVVPVGIDGVDDDVKITVVPNPCGDWLMVEGEGIVSASVYDMSGRVVLANVEMNKRIDTKALPSGVYLLRVVHDDTVATKTIIKK